MKTKKLIITTLLIGSISINANAQDLNLNYSDGNVSMPLTSSQSMSIDSNTGDINISTSISAETIGENLGLECSGDAPNLLLTNSPIGTTAATVFHNITSVDAVYCVKSGSWSGTLLGNPLVLNGSAQVNTNGNYSMSCSNAYGASNNITTVVSSIETILNPTLTLSASPSSVASGESSTLTWVIGNTPTSCTKTSSPFDSNWTGNMSAGEITNGSHNEVVSNITSNITYSLVCDNSAAGNSGTKSVSITMTGNAACNTQPPILGGNEDHDPENYSDVSPGTIGGFPGAEGGSISFAIDRNKYVALGFNSGTTIFNSATFAFSISGNGQGGSAADATTIAFSECPGDFATHLNQPACKKEGGGTPQIRWSVDPSQNSAAFCKLDKNKEYYMNIVHSNTSLGNYNTSACASSVCGVLMGASF